MRAFTLILITIPLLCAKPKCTGIVWYIDETLNMCLAKHCCKAKGTLNFNSYIECSGGLMMDQFSCGGGVQHKSMCNRIQFIPQLPPNGTYPTAPPTQPPKVPECPDGEQCIWGPFDFGFCCEKHNEEIWSANYKAKCGSGKRTITQQNMGAEGVKYPLFGKTCAHVFCPKGAKCVQGKYLAYCCGS